MSAEWFYSRDGKSKTGPISSAQLQALVKSGQLQPTDMVLKTGTEKWVKGSQIKGLFPEGAASSTAAANPASAKKSPSNLRPGQSVSPDAGDFPSATPSIPTDRHDSMGRMGRPWTRPLMFISSIGGGLLLLLCIGLFGLRLLLENQPPYAPAVNTVEKLAKAQEAEFLKKFGTLQNVPESENRPAFDKIKDKADALFDIVHPLPIALDPGAGEIVAEAELGKPTLDSLGIFGWFGRFPVKYRAKVPIPQYGKMKLIAKSYERDGTVIQESEIIQKTDAAANETVAGTFSVEISNMKKVVTFKVFAKGSNGPVVQTTKMPDQEPEGNKKVPESQAAIRVSAEELFQAYRDNQVGANQRYKDKVVEVIGIVHGVTERFGQCYVELNENDGQFNLGLVHVHFDKASKDKLASLSKGQIVRARGLCTGKTISFVDVKNAQLVETAMDDVKPPQIPEVDLPALLKKLADPKERLSAIEALGSLGGRAQTAIPKLIPFLKEDADLRRAAAAALDKIGPPAKTDFDTVLDYLKDENPKVRIYAAKAAANLPEVTQRILTALTTAMKDTESDVRLHVVNALVNCATATGFQEKALPPLLNALADTDAGVRQYVRDGLASLDPPINFENDFLALKGAAKHVNADVRLFAIHILATPIRPNVPYEFATPAMVEIFAAASQDMQPTIRKRAVEGLGKANRDAKPLAFPPLIEALNDQDSLVRDASLASLAKLGAPPAAELPRLVKLARHSNADVRLFGLKVLAASDKVEIIVPVIAEALKDEDKKVARLAAEALGNLGVGAVPAVAALQQVVVKDSDKDLRRQAISALGKIGRSKGSLEALCSALEDQDLRKNALAALEKVGPFDKMDIPVLAPLLKSANLDTRSFAVGELAKLGTDAVNMLGEALGDKDRGLRLKAAAALGAMKGKDAALSLTEALLKEDDTEVRREITDALSKVGPEAKIAVEPLAKSLSDKDRMLRRVAAVALGKIGPDAKPAIPRLVLALKELPPPQGQTIPPPVRPVVKNPSQQKILDQKFKIALEEYRQYQAKVGAGQKEFYRDLEAFVTALANMGKDAVPALTDALKHKSPMVRLGAAMALGQIGPDAASAIQPLALMRQPTNEPSAEIRAAVDQALARIRTK